MHKAPSLSEYVVARLITLIIITTTLFTLVIYLTPESYKSIGFYALLFFLSQVLFLMAVVYRTRYFSKELKKVEQMITENSAVRDEKSINFFTIEFENIHKKLLNILKKIKKREHEKRKYNAKIKLKNRQRSDMLSAIAHEFRNPIAAIMGYSQTLVDDEEIPKHLQQKFLTKIWNNGEKIEELLSRLLLWNRFESGEQKLYSSEFNMKPLAHEIALNLEEKYKERKIVIEGTSCMVKADKALMEIVLKNLMENALKYSEDSVRVQFIDNEVKVIDTGIGISEENVEKVVKKFFRTNEHTWENSMGLGLSIVKQILKLHNSSLQIESEENKGSTFSFKVS
ncbi:MAG TPA: HAMP domain-containing histidine kinase [Campylobacterales bacterium]|nr:HAMP domain-containing histidine kinase [Campylobacterales bacterium]